MTDDDKALVERLRSKDGTLAGLIEAALKAADTLKAQAREIARLREANRFLRRGLYGLIESDDADDIATTLEAKP